MYKYSILLIFMLTFSLQAQLTAEKTSIDSGGGIISAGNIVYLSTVGEVFIEEIANDNLQISEGFISKEILSSLGFEMYESIQGVLVYPNPIQDFVKIIMVEKKEYTLSIYDTNGRLINRFIQNTDDFELNLMDLTSATYWLILTDEQTKQMKSLSIIKK